MLLSSLLLVFLCPIEYHCHAFAPTSSLANATKSTILHLSKRASATTVVPVINKGVGLAVFGGGLMGYAKAKSKASLMAGSTLGGLLWAAGSLIARQKTVGATLGSVISSLLTYTMGKKFLKSGKFMPAGLVASLGLVALVANVVEWIMGSQDTDNAADF